MKTEVDFQSPVWDASVDKWTSKQETDSYLSIKMEKHQMLYSLVVKKLSLPVRPGKRRFSNPNPETVLYQILCDADFYHRNKHRFEYLEHCYGAKHYGSEVYWKSYKAPPEVNAEVDRRNRIKVCKRMITNITNKIEAFEQGQAKLLFPVENHRGYNRLKLKLEKYSNELKELNDEILKNNKEDS